MTDISTHVFRTDRRVEFCETDAAGIAHFSAFVIYMEQAEHAFWRSLDLSVVTELEQGWHLSWPRVHVSCDYRGTAKFEDLLEIQVRILKLGSKSLTYGFNFVLGESTIATGTIVAVCCRVRAGDELESVEIPDNLRTKLVPFVTPAG